MRKLATFCIKTIHRPQCCAALVRSIYHHCNDERPLIYVLDDGMPDLRFKTHFPEEAAMTDKIVETDYDIGLSAGRNQLLDTATTPFVFFADDDHQVTKKTHLRGLLDTLIHNKDVELLATLSNNVGRPRLLKVEGQTLRIPRGFYKARGSIRWCHFVSNCFVGYREVLSAIRWDEALKMEEHWDFFWRAKLARVKVAVDIQRSFDHRHVDSPGYQRKRPEFLRASKEKYCLKRVIWR